MSVIGKKPDIKHEMLYWYIYPIQDTLYIWIIY